MRTKSFTIILLAALIVTLAAYPNIRNAEANFILQKPDRASQMLTEANRPKIDQARRYLVLGFCHVNLREYEKAIECFKEAIRLKPDYAIVYFNLGLLYTERLKQYQKAIEYLNEAIRLNQKNADAHAVLGDAYFGLKQYKAAIRCYKESLITRPDYARVHFNLGVTYSRIAQFDKAIESFKEAIRINPKHATALSFLGISYSNQGQKAPAADCFYRAGVIFIEQGNNKAALAAYDSLKYAENKQLEHKLYQKLYPKE
jgi:tetratricopeptide (TPR) repeat protein